MARTSDVSHLEQLLDGVTISPTPVLHNGIVCMITLTQKIWCPKPHNKYIPLDYSNDVDNGIFYYLYYGKTVYCPKVWWSDCPRTDLTVFDINLDMKELDSRLVIGSGNSTSSASRIRSIIIKYWDYFCARGVCRTILDNKFQIDTGAPAPIYCRKPRYSPRQKKVIMQQINNLLKKKWIREYGSFWGSMIILAANTHQEDIDDIRKFVWRMCVSYNGLNKATKIYEYPIPRCDMAITIIELGSTGIYFITVDAKQGYHQITVRDFDVEKLAFFGSDNKTYGFTIIPFGPVNTPPFIRA